MSCDNQHVQFDTGPRCWQQGAASNIRRLSFVGQCRRMVNSDGYAISFVVVSQEQ